MRVAVAALLVAVGAAIGVLVMSLVLSRRVDKLEYEQGQTFKVIDTEGAGVQKRILNLADGIHDLGNRITKLEGH